MDEQKPLKGPERTELLNSLYSKFGKKPGWKQRLLYYRKKYAWIFVISLAKFIKRFFDVLISVLLLVLLSPLFLLIALMIKLDDGGPIFYISKRVGKWGEEFPFPKFRTMKVGADKLQAELQAQSMHKDEGTFKIAKDPRITRIGGFLRRFSLDELPQLYSVLTGKMSLVGPRPPLPSEVARYTLEDRRRLDIVPGITCIWQVSGRSDIPFDKQVLLDREYIESQSLWLDFVLLLKTIPAVLFGRGAY